MIEACRRRFNLWYNNSGYSQTPATACIIRPHTAQRRQLQLLQVRRERRERQVKLNGSATEV